MNPDAINHWILSQALKPGERRFRQHRNRLEKTQRERMAKLLHDASESMMGRQQGLSPRWRWEDVATRLPVTRYRDWDPGIRYQMNNRVDAMTTSPVIRYQPTSGASTTIKWIPYTQRFLDELNGAITPWLRDLYQRHPAIRQGRHYWSQPWMPPNLRETVRGPISGDMKLLNTSKRLFASRTQAVPDNVCLAPTSDDALFATLAYLVTCPDLSLMSIWSPTFGLGLLEKMGRWKDELSDVIAEGHWGRRRATLKHLKAPCSRIASQRLRSWDGSLNADFFRELWPRLALVSAWGTAAARPWSRKLSACLPQASFQSKGLWATEGAVTIPYGEQDQHVLAVNSHAYEFEDVATGEVIPPWSLAVNQEVVPLITTGSGFFRYRLGDRVRVTGFQGALPCLEFLGRDDGVDMVGEKVGTIAVQNLFNTMEWPEGVDPVTLLGIDHGGAGDRPCYLLLAETPPGTGNQECNRLADRLARQLEYGLGENDHYQFARNLGQLAPARCLCRPDMSQHYISICRDRGMIEGNIKVEALRHWQGPLPETFGPMHDDSVPGSRLA